MALTCRWRSRPQHQERTFLGVPFGKDGWAGWCWARRRQQGTPAASRADSRNPSPFPWLLVHILFLPRPEDDFDVTVLPRVELSEGHRGVIQREVMADDLAWLGGAGNDHVA